MKKLRVTIEGKSYDALAEILDDGVRNAPPAMPVAARPVEAVAVASVAPVAVAAPPRAAGGAGDVPSPLAGKVVSIDVTVGQTVAEGAQVATVEAMKMNTYIFAPKAGRVESISVNPGDGVQEGTPLLRIV